MADIFSPEKRSEIMSRIRGKDTKVEVLVQRTLRKSGVYFRKHYRTRFGIVIDIALPRKKRAVMIDGDFWHGRTLDKVRERRGTDDFWTKKIERNIERDKEQQELLIRNSWKLLRVWESDLVAKSRRDMALESIINFLTL